MHDDVALRAAARRLERDWQLVLVLGIPVVSVALLALRWFVDAPLEFGPTVAVAPAVFWTVAAVLMLLALCAGGLFRGRALHPRALARRPSSAHPSESAGAVELAEARIRETTFMLLAILDFPAVLLLVYGLVANDDIALVLAIGHCVAAFVLIKPDIPQLLQATAHEIDAGNLAGRNGAP